VDLLAFISRQLVAPAHAAWEGSVHLREYRRLLQTQFDPPEVIAERQATALREIATHAAATVPFWRERFQSAGLLAKQIESVDCLRRLPILTKQTIREQGEQLLSSEFDRSQLHVHSTSGSTGVSLVTYRDERCQQLKRGATLRADEWSGWRRGEPIAAVWGNPDYPRTLKARLRNWLLSRNYAWLDTVKMDEAAMSEFADTLVKRPPSLLFGHAHSLHLFASYLEAKRPHVRVVPKGIISTCMVLHDFERETIERVFDCKVTNRYGCEEVSLIACECERHEGLHVNSDCLVVELVDQQGEPCLPGVPGRILVTDLTNRAMPLFRYEVGDMASWAAQPCSCGRTLPMLERIEGRVADYVVTSRGEYISGISLTENFAVQVPGVAQIQIVQEQLDWFVYNIVKGSTFNEQSLSKIAELTVTRFGNEARHECVFVDKIPQEKSGKYRFCISKVEKSFS
jgi:phenylacetate-CoA ligase